MSAHGGLLISQEGTINRERVLKILLVLVGLLFSAGVYPVTDSLWDANQSLYTEDMMLSLYVTLAFSCRQRSATLRQIAASSPSQHGRVSLTPLLWR